MPMYYVLHDCNIALQTEVWRLNMDEAKAVQEHLNCAKGGYWHSKLVCPYRAAKRAKLDIVKVYTSGFFSGEFSNALYAAGYTVEAF